MAVAGDGRLALDDQAGITFAQRLRGSFDAERGRFFLWAPVCLGAGIAAYFALPLEPGLAAAVAPALIATIVLAALARGTLAAACGVGLLLAACGFIAAKVRVETVRAPVLAKIVTKAQVTGRLVRVEPRSPRGERLTIDVETMGEMASDVRPRRIRVRTMTARAAGTPPLKAGQRISLTATLSPPAKPAIPGGFDFARTAWFEALGGVGYTFNAPQILPEVEPVGVRLRVASAIEDVRASINARIKAVLPGETGAIAAALITGERGGITEATNTAYRNAGLFHILSISGLHMVVMAGAVFFIVRLTLAAIPGLALRYDIKKWAAVAGIIGALLYLAISGGAFATVRSAIQIVIMFVAVLLDRPALALRNVALAAFLILVVWPESLFDAGFQMSFAAVTGLIAAYEEVRRRFTNRAEPHPILRVVMFFGGIVLTTLVASAAVAPFAAYHFHTSQQYAVLANLIAIPICNFVVMPAALATLIAMPFGLEAPALAVMGLGIEAMSVAARQVAALPGAVAHVPAIPGLSFALLVAGGLWLALWQAHWRIAGAVPVVAGTLLAPYLPRPDVLVARGGELVAVRAQDGALSALPARQSKFELKRWLEHDGDARSAEAAAKAEAFVCDGAGCVARVKGLLVAVARHPAAIGDDCVAANIVVLNVPRPKRGCEGAAHVIDFFDIWRDGTHALYVMPGSASGGVPAMLRVETVAAYRGDRPWSPQIRPRLPGPRIAARTPQPGSGAEPGADGRNADVAEPHSGRARLPAFARRPDWLAPLPPRPDVEDDDEEVSDAEPAPGGETSPGGPSPDPSGAPPYPQPDAPIAPHTGETDPAGRAQ